MPTAETLKAMWASTEWDDPDSNFSRDEQIRWDFLYETGRCPQVLEETFRTLKFTRTDAANEDANEILYQADRYFRSKLISKWFTDHGREASEAFNAWWWMKHNIEDYTEG